MLQSAVDLPLGVPERVRHVIEHGLHVVPRAEVFHHLLGLERPTQAEPHAPRRVQTQKRCAGNTHLTSLGTDKAAENIDQGRFSGAVGADQTAHRRLQHGVQSIDDCDGPERDGQAANVDHAPLHRARVRAIAAIHWPTSPRGAVMSACRSAAPKKIMAR